MFAGRVSAVAGSSSCTVCPYGSYQSLSGQTSCIVCSSGMFSAGGADLCSTTVRVVVSNTYSACGSAFCATCGAGTWCNCYEYFYGGDRRRAQEKDGEPTPVNPLEDPDFASESLMDVGLVMENLEMKKLVMEYQCSQCSPGQYCPGTGLGYACPAGMWSSWGCTACTPCAAGTYRTASSCTQVPAGNARS